MTFPTDKDLETTAGFRGDLANRGMVDLKLLDLDKNPPTSTEVPSISIKPPTSTEVPPISIEDTPPTSTEVPSISTKDTPPPPASLEDVPLAPLPTKLVEITVGGA